MVEVRGRENLALYLEDKNVWIIENRKKYIEIRWWIQFFFSS